MASGSYGSEDDVLRETEALRHRNQDVVAINEAIADMEAGDRGNSFDQFVEDFRRRHGIAP